MSKQHSKNISTLSDFHDQGVNSNVFFCAFTVLTYCHFHLCLAILLPLQAQSQIPCQIKACKTLPQADNAFHPKSPNLMVNSRASSSQNWSITRDGIGWRKRMELHGLGHGSNMSLDWITSAALSKAG